MRGFHRGRLRGRDRLVISADYRYPIWGDYPMLMDGVLFVETGQVSDDIFTKLDTGKFEWGYGGGIRFYHHEGLVVRFALGFSEDEVRFYFGMND
jgi:hemolysin activation/secretion protein